jgi:hypothetical protein
MVEVTRLIDPEMMVEIEVEAIVGDRRKSSKTTKQQSNK